MAPPKKTPMKKFSTYLLTATVAGLFMTGCKPKPEPIVLGKDECAECKMIIADPKFGGEIVSKNGKVYKFDDPHCIAVFLERRGIELNNISRTLFVNYNEPHDLIDVKNAEFVVSSQMKGPMGGNSGAFNGRKAAEQKSAEISGSRVTDWATLYNILVK
jgi:copper chaperone NosL